MSEYSPPGERIFEPGYWKDRLLHAIDREQVHHAIFVTGSQQWSQIAEQHRELLARHVRSDESILDAGCGWGRLLSLTPRYWKGDYLGIDISPDFLESARASHPARTFLLHDMREPLPERYRNVFDWAVLISIRQMVRENAGEEAWETVQRNLFDASRRILVLEYSSEDQGEVLVRKEQGS
jgi:cyclopropane fatty-acyl-phospholipid synthase-like methyltransferase